MRTTWRRSATTIAIGLLLSGCWLQPRLEPGRTNYAAGGQTLSAATVGGLTELWSTSMSSPTATAAEVLAPIALDDAVYVAATSGDVPGVAASFDAATGELRWTTPLNLDIPPMPISLDDPVYHGSRLRVPWSVQRGDGMFAVDPATGAASVDSGGLIGDLAILDGVLIGKSAQFVPSPPLMVTTQVRMGSFVPTVTSQGSTVGPARGDFAIVGGNVAWSDTGTSALGFTPQCPEVPGIPRTTACMPDWTVDLGAIPGNPTAVGDDAVVYADNSGTVSVFDMATGAIRWQAEMGAVSLRQATVTPDVILVATSDGRLVALPAAGCGGATCAPLWEGTIGGPAQALVAAGDVAYVSTTAGTGDIAAFDLAGCGAASCDPLVTVAAGHPLSHSMIVHDGRLVAGTLDGHVVAFGLG